MCLRMGRLKIIGAEEPKKTIAEIIKAKKQAFDIIYNLEKLNEQQETNRIFKAKLREIMRTPKAITPL